MKKSIIAITLTLLLVFTVTVPVFAYWPSAGSNPFATDVRYMSQFAESGNLYFAYTDSYGYLTVKKCTNGVWETLGTEDFTASSEPVDYGKVEELSIYVHNGVPYIAYVDLDNYTRHVTVIKYNSSTNSWDIIGKQIVPNDGGYHYATDYLTMYVSDTGMPYVAFADTLDGYGNTCKVTLMFYDSDNGLYGGWGGNVISDLYCMSTPSMVVTDDYSKYVAYIERDTQTNKDYLMVRQCLPNLDPVITPAIWNDYLKMEVGDSDKVELRYDSNKLFLCSYTADGSMAVYVHDFADSSAYGVNWEQLGTLPINCDSDYVSMAVYDGTPYVAFQETNYFVSVVKYDGANWVGVGDQTASSTTVTGVVLSNDQNDLYLSTICGYGNIDAFSYKYTVPVVPVSYNLSFSQNTGGYFTVSAGNESDSFSDAAKTFSLPAGLDLNLEFHANIGYVVNSVLIDGTNIITSPCSTATCSVSMTRSHNIVIEYAVALTDAAPPTITTEPSDITVNKGETASLTLEAAGTGDLSYQWYSNEINSMEGASIIEGATGSSYSAPTGTAGTVYYYCAVINTDNTATGNTTATTTSRAASVTVLDITAEPIDQIISAVMDAINNGELTGNGNPDKLAAFEAKLLEAKLKIEAGDITAAINILESTYKQIDGRPSPRDLVVGDSADEIAQMILKQIDELKLLQ